MTFFKQAFTRIFEHANVNVASNYLIFNFNNAATIIHLTDRKLINDNS